MFSFTIGKSISNIPKLDRELRDINDGYTSLTSKGNLLELFFSRSLNQSEVDLISSHVNSFVEYSVLDNLKNFVGKAVDIYVSDYLIRVRAESLELGISPTNGILEFQAWVEKQVDIRGNGYLVSYLGCLQTGALSLAIEVLQYYRDNPNLWADLEPFVTDTKLASWQQEFIAFLSQSR